MKAVLRTPENERIIVWLAQLSASQRALPSLNSYLDAGDVDRASRFRFPEDKSRFILGRALARECLGRELNRVPASLDFTYTQRGRPVLAGIHAIHFSIAHARDYVAVAITQNAQVGIDLEYMRQEADIDQLSESVFSIADRQHFNSLDAAKKREAFFRAWTRKEAYLKARGEGITDGLVEVSVSFDVKEPFIRDTRVTAATEKWFLHDLPVDADYAGSIACDNAGKIPELHRVRFDPGGILVQSPPE